MSWSEAALARQLLSEEFVGSRLRDARRAEDAQAKAITDQLRRSTP